MRRSSPPPSARSSPRSRRRAAARARCFEGTSILRRVRSTRRRSTQSSARAASSRMASTRSPSAASPGCTARRWAARWASTRGPPSPGATTRRSSTETSQCWSPSSRECSRPCGAPASTSWPFISTCPARSRGSCSSIIGASAAPRTWPRGSRPRSTRSTGRWFRDTPLVRASGIRPSVHGFAAKEIHMRLASIALVVLMGTAMASAQEHEAHERAEAAKNAPALAAAMKEATVSLANGLRASETEGTPISGKFEVDDGTLQLSVYTMKGDKFFEVVVDHKSGRVLKTEPITGGEDLTAAKQQAEAMAKAKRSLADVVTKDEKANAGYRAVSVTPEIEKGAARADVVLLKGTEAKEVEEKL